MLRPYEKNPEYSNSFQNIFAKHRPYALKNTGGKDYIPIAPAVVVHRTTAQQTMKSVKQL